MSAKRSNDVAIIASAELKNVIKSGRGVHDLAGEVMSLVLDEANLSKGDVDGFIVCNSLTECGNPFWSAILADYLGLELSWCDCVDLGGASFVAAVSRAVMALRSGECTTVLVLAADAPSTLNNQRFGSYRPEWQDPYGLMGPAGLFGLLMSRYASQYQLKPEALAKLAVTQRDHALLNELACDRLRTPLNAEDYLNSRMISDPVRLLDCVMVCDGATAVVLTTTENAKRLGTPIKVHPVGYGECTNHKIDDPCPDITETGHSVAGPKALARASMSLDEIRMFHPYDDFLIAMLLQLEQIGFCRPGEGSEYILSTDFTFKGDLPLNTGGGQISAGQAGLAGGGHNFVEATRQIMGKATGRQVSDPINAMVTGIGTIPYARNWSVSNVIILERGD